MRTNLIVYLLIPENIVVREIWSACAFLHIRLIYFSHLWLHLGTIRYMLAVATRVSISHVSL